MAASGRQIVAKVGPVAVAVVGASVASVGTATVIVASGAAVALAAAGFGVYRWLSSNPQPEKLIDSEDGQLPERDQ